MKASKYNRFLKSKDGKKHMLFNGMTGALATLDGEEQYRQVTQILKEPDKESLYENVAVQDLSDKLVKGGYLIEDTVDELALLKIRNRMGRFKDNGFSLTILPTLDCNFRCTYCYQEHQNKVMTTEVEEAVVRLVEERIRPNEPLRITWFGGEPLLSLKKILRLTEKFEQICEQRESSYSAGMITNGFLLSRKVTQQLRNAKVGFLQITLDGVKEAHDKKRFLSNGMGTYDRIMRNIENAVNDLATEDGPSIWISIRINVDKHNYTEVSLLLDELEQRGLKGKIGVYVAQVREYTDICNSVGGSCFSDQEYTAIEVELYQQFISRGFKVTKYPSVRFGYCTADSPNSVVVGPDGALYGCWSDVGTTNMIGHLLQQNGKHYPRFIEYLSWDPFAKKECVECEILPICMGGCPYQAIRKGLSNGGICETWKSNLEEMLQLYYASRISENLS